MASVHHCSVCVLFIKYIHGLVHRYFLIETNKVSAQFVNVNNKHIQVTIYVKRHIHLILERARRTVSEYINSVSSEDCVGVC